MTSSPNDDTAHRSWLLPIGVAILAGLGAAGGTFALWSDHDDTNGHLIASGDLKVTSLGTPEWEETSPDVVSVPQTIDPTTFLVRPGDAVAVEIPFETTMRGDNLSTELIVDWSADSAVPAGVTGTYVLVDPNGTELTDDPTNLGQAIDFDATDGGHYAVRVELDFAGLQHRFGADDVDPLSELGNFDVEVHQVRPGGESS